MKIVSSWGNLLSTGYKHHVYSGTPGHKCFYDSIDDPMGDHRYDTYPIKPEIKEWLANLPKWTYRVPEQYFRREIVVAWNRPILFRKIEHVVLFKLMWG
jgi:hypothetical protein